MLIEMGLVHAYLFCPKMGLITCADTALFAVANQYMECSGDLDIRIGRGSSQQLAEIEPAELIAAAPKK